MALTPYFGSVFGPDPDVLDIYDPYSGSQLWTGDQSRQLSLQRPLREAREVIINIVPSNLIYTLLMPNAVGGCHYCYCSCSYY